MTDYDDMNLDRAYWALEDTKRLVGRAKSCLKFCEGMNVEADALGGLYYAIQDIQDRIEEKVDRRRVKE